jgi:hypothetical protein
MKTPVQEKRYVDVQHFVDGEMPIISPFCNIDFWDAHTYEIMCVSTPPSSSTILFLAANGAIEVCAAAYLKEKQDQDAPVSDEDSTSSPDANTVSVPDSRDVEVVGNLAATTATTTVAASETSIAFGVGGNGIPIIDLSLNTTYGVACEAGTGVQNDDDALFDALEEYYNFLDSGCPEPSAGENTTDYSGQSSTPQVNIMEPPDDIFIEAHTSGDNLNVIELDDSMISLSFKDLMDRHNGNPMIGASLSNRNLCVPTENSEPYVMDLTF